MLHVHYLCKQTPVLPRFVCCFLTRTKNFHPERRHVMCCDDLYSAECPTGRWWSTLDGSSDGMRLSSSRSWIGPSPLSNVDRPRIPTVLGLLEESRCFQEHIAIGVHKCFHIIFSPIFFYVVCDWSIFYCSEN
jgi:hypothetical protein